MTDRQTALWLAQKNLQKIGKVSVKNIIHDRKIYTKAQGNIFFIA